MSKLVKGTENELGIFVAGGKGATSRKTPAEITAACERTGRDPEPLVYASRISAKVDNSAVQDGYQLYDAFYASQALPSGAAARSAPQPTCRARAIYRRKRNSSLVRHAIRYTRPVQLGLGQRNP